MRYSATDSPPRPLPDDDDPDPVLTEIVAGFAEPDEGPDGNHGRVTCAVCVQPGWLMSANGRGFLIRHDGSPFPHRAPR